MPPALASAHSGRAAAASKRKTPATNSNAGLLFRALRTSKLAIASEHGAIIYNALAVAQRTFGSRARSAATTTSRALTAARAPPDYKTLQVTPRLADDRREKRRPPLKIMPSGSSILRLRRPVRLFRRFGQLYPRTFLLLDRIIKRPHHDLHPCRRQRRLPATHVNPYSRRISFCPHPACHFLWTRALSQLCAVSACSLDNLAATPTPTSSNKSFPTCNAGTGWTVIFRSWCYWLQGNFTTRA